MATTWVAAGRRLARCLQRLSKSSLKPFGHLSRCLLTPGLSRCRSKRSGLASDRFCYPDPFDVRAELAEKCGNRAFGRAKQRGAVAELGDNQLRRNSGQSGPAFVDGSAERLSAVPQYCREQALQDGLFWVEDREQSGDASSHWRDELGERGYSFGVAAVGSGQQSGEDRTAVGQIADCDARAAQQCIPADLGLPAAVAAAVARRSAVSNHHVPNPAGVVDVSQQLVARD